jgi:hypothetical protein
MGRLTALVLAGVVAAAVPAASHAAAVLQNGAFTDPGDGIPRGWRVEAWNRDLSEVTLDAGVGEGRAVRIVNRDANDARVCQTIAVTPGATYRVSAHVKTAGVGQQTAGALIAIEPRIADSADVKGTSDWQPLEVTAANADASTWDICVRLGSYANLNTGTAWFTDVQVQQIGGAVDGGGGTRWPSLGLAPLVASLRQTPWAQTALPIVGGLVLAFGLGLFSRRPR